MCPRFHVRVIEQEGEASPGSEANSGNHLEQAASSAASPDAFDLKYAELRTQGKSHKAATELAKIYADGATDNGTPDGTQHTLADDGGLDPDQTLELMSDIAPGVSADVIDVINESVVDLAGEVIKRSNSGAYDEADVDAATEMIKRAFRGELDAEGVSDLLELEQ